MISLAGKSLASNLHKPLRDQVFRLRASSDNSGFLLESHDSKDENRLVRLFLNEDTQYESEEYVVAPHFLSYLKDGDIIALSEIGDNIKVLWRGNDATNSILLTERCDNLCLMCSQPPKTRNDDWLLQQAFDLVSLAPLDAREIGITGGEPTLYGSRFNDLVEHIAQRLPETALHILSNGRKFSDADFARDYASRTNELTMVGIPIYGSEPKLHDYVVQAHGAFDETIHGILNLAELGQAIEIRVVLHAITAPKIVEIAEFIARNLPFVDQVALMGLEMMGFARRNQEILRIDPMAYRDDLVEATEHLDAHRIRTRIYNHQLCLLHPDIRRFAVRSISDWKNEFDPICTSCDLLDRCGGFFHSAKYGSAGLIQPLNSDGSPKNPATNSPVVDSESSKTWRRKFIPVTPVIPD